MIRPFEKISDYEDLIDEYMHRNGLYGSDDYYRDMVITIDEGDNIVLVME